MKICFPYLSLQIFIVGSGALALGIILGTIVLSLLLVVALLIKKKKTRG